MKKIRLVITAMIGGLSMMALAGAAMAQDAAGGEAAGGGYATDGKEVGIVYLNSSEDGEAVELSVEQLDVLNAALATNSTGFFGDGNFTGGNSTGGGIVVSIGDSNYTFESFSINDTKITGVSNQAYTGKAVTLSGLAVLYPYGGEDLKLTEGVHYTVKYENNVNPGTAKVTISGTGNVNGGLEGSKTITFNIAAPAVKTGADIGTEHVLLSGASKAVYLVTSSDTVQFKKSLVGKKAKKATVPDAVTINNKVYKVTGIGAKAFNKCKAVKKLTVQAVGLTAGNCKKCLKSSRVTTVKVPKSVKKAYKKIFVKKVCGKKVKAK